MGIRETLLELIESTTSDVKVAIVKVLLECYETNSFYLINDLSKKSFTSKSTITKFCVSLGYEGYKDFLTMLKIDVKNYNKVYNSIGQPNTSTDAYEDVKNYALKVIEYIDSQKEIITGLSNLVTSKKINLIYSYKIQPNIQIFASLLKTKGYFTNYAPIMSKNFSIDVDVKDDVFLVFASGPDNSRLFSTYKAIKNNNKVFIFTSASLSQYFDTYEYKMIIDLEKTSTRYAKRNLFLTYLFTQIIDNLK